MNQTFTTSQNITRRSERNKRRDANSAGLLGITARVRRAELTPLGHVSVVLDTPAGRLRALSDAAAVHLPQLQPGTQVQVILLRLRRATADAVWHWQLLCCRATTEGVNAPAAAMEGSRA